jgi:hypothetical protein
MKEVCALIDDCVANKVAVWNSGPFSESASSIQLSSKDIQCNAKFHSGNNIIKVILLVLNSA